jgi:hypothetical protein
MDELRMQMLGAQIFFAFQFDAVFQERFETLPMVARWVAAVGLVLMVVTIACLISPSAFHRLAEKGKATGRMHTVATAFAMLATAPFSFAIGCAVFTVLILLTDFLSATLAAVMAVLAALFFWCFLGLIVAQEKPQRRQEYPMAEESPTELHGRIEQMLVEARVILPGVQALLGFQFIAMMTKKFESLPLETQYVHVGVLGALLLSVMLLIAPATIHRLSFGGQDSVRFLKIGSALVTTALIPLAFGIAGDVYIALGIMVEGMAPFIIGATSFVVLFICWYAMPMVAKMMLAESR